MCGSTVLGKGMGMLPWSTDARETIRDLSLIDADCVEETIEIKRFLRQDRYNIVVATKGFGKSLLLLAKRKNLQSVHHVVPHDLLLDAPSIDVNVLSRDAQSILYDRESLSRLWGICLLIATVKSTLDVEAFEQARPSPTLAALLGRDTCRTVSGALSNILHDVSWSDFALLREEYGRVLVPLAQSITTPVGVFLDNVDECFRENRDLWYDAQTALIDAAYRVLRVNPKIRLYVSIRKEAFLKYAPTTEMSLQYEGICLVLVYSKEELKDIFIRNIRAEMREAMVLPEQLSADPVLAFIGTQRVPHAYVDDEEPAFDFIYRHTLKRPRDL